MRIIVADAGPLIALSRIRRLGLLPALFKQVVVPAIVVEELRLMEERPGVAHLAEAVDGRTWLKVMHPRDDRPMAVLDRGEAAAIRLAIQLRCPLLMDERRGRLAARSRCLPVFGTGRVLLWAKKKRLIEFVGPVLQQLRGNGYRLANALCQRLLALAGEGKP